MQTFIVDKNLRQSAAFLDNKRLGKQRVEALQILNDLLIEPSTWRNHPAVKMWHGYERCLVHYTFNILEEWHVNRNFKNEQCGIKILKFMDLTNNLKLVVPPWLNDEFILAHRSNLIRKNPEHYKKFWPDVPDNLPYVWPV